MSVRFETIRVEGCRPGPLAGRLTKPLAAGRTVADGSIVRARVP